MALSVSRDDHDVGIRRQQPHVIAESRDAMTVRAAYRKSLASADDKADFAAPLLENPGVQALLTRTKSRGPGLPATMSLSS